MNSDIKIYTDGGARGNPGPSASAFIVIKNSKIIHKGSRYLGRATNNEAEYNAVIDAFEWLTKSNIREAINKVFFNIDSELVVNQLKGNYKTKSENLKPLITRIKILGNILDKEIVYRAVPREDNRLADKLVNQKLDLIKYTRGFDEKV